MPPKTKTPEQRSALQQLILDAARELFVARGIEAVSMREIAKRVGYSPTTLYLYFQDKQHLLQTLCDHDFLTLAHELRALEQEDNPLAQIKALCQSYSRYAQLYPNQYRLMFMTPKFNISKDTTTLRHGNPEQDAYAYLLAMVESAHQQQVFHPEAGDSNLIAQTLWAGIHGVCSLQIIFAEDDWLDWQAYEARVHLMQQTLLAGLLKPA